MRVGVENRGRAADGADAVCICMIALGAFGDTAGLTSLGCYTGSSVPAMAGCNAFSSTAFAASLGGGTGGIAPAVSGCVALGNATLGAGLGSGASSRFPAVAAGGRLCFRWSGRCLSRRRGGFFGRSSSRLFRGSFCRSCRTLCAVGGIFRVTSGGCCAVSGSLVGVAGISGLVVAASAQAQQHDKR